MDQPISDTVKDEIDTETKVFYRTIFSEIPLIALFLSSCIMMVYFSRLYTWSVEPIHLYQTDSWSLELGLPLFALFPIVIFTFVIHRLYNYRFIIDDRGVRAIEGVLSFNKHDTRIEFCNIRGIEVDRGLLGRIFNFGTMKIGSAMKSEAEIILRDIQNPSYYRDIILSRSREQIKGLAGYPLSSE